MDPSAVSSVHEGHVDTDTLEVYGSRVAGGVGGEHHRTPPRFHRVEVDETPHRRRQHHPDKIVALKNVGSFNRPCRNDQRFRPRLDQPLVDPWNSPLHHRHPIVVVAAVHHRVCHHFDVV